MEEKRLAHSRTGEVKPLPAYGALAIKQPKEIYKGYDPEREEIDYARSLLSKEELEKVKAEIDRTGFWTVEQIRGLLLQNTSARCSADGIFVLDADLVIKIDQYSRDCIYILPNNSVFTREQLTETYPFDLFGSEPEEIFSQQEVGVFPAPASYMDKSLKEYLCRDHGTDEEFIMLEDTVGQMTRKNYKERRPAERIVLTKVFLAREGWEDFMTMVKEVRAKRRLYSNALKRWRETGQHNLLSLKLAAATGKALAPPAANLALEDADTVEGRARRGREAAEEQARAMQSEIDSLTLLLDAL